MLNCGIIEKTKKGPYNFSMFILKNETNRIRPIFSYEAIVNTQGIITCYLTKILIRYRSIPWFNKIDTREILGYYLDKKKERFKPGIF